MYGGKQICPIFFIKPSQIVVNALKTLEKFFPICFFALFMSGLFCNYKEVGRQ